MKLNPAKFNAFGALAGQSVSWRQAFECPCRDPDSNMPRQDCNACTNGQIWKPPVCTRLALTGQKQLQQWANFGMFEKGDVVCSLLSDTPIYKMGTYDRVEFTDSSQPFSIAYQNSETPLVLKFDVVEITRLFWLDPTFTDVIDGPLPTVAEDGTVVFGATAPPVNTPFTLSGRRHPEYFCFQDFPQDRAHFGGLSLPRLVVLRNWDLFKRAP